jgi:hypothetical protein
MGTTLTALQAQSGVRYQWVVAIEGYDYLLTDGDPNLAIAAWSGTGWTQALGGLVVVGGYEQNLDPWAQRFEVGQITFAVLDCDGADRFGIDTHATGSGNETALEASLDCNDTTVTAVSVDVFAASGDIHIGTERISYSSRSTGADTFTVATDGRGKFAPFKADSEAEQRFARQHRVLNTMPSIATRHVITDAPRTWPGRIVGAWLHRVVGTTLDTRAQAQCTFAGKIVAVRDSPNGHTEIVCEDAKSMVRDAVMLRNQYTARAREGVYLVEGMVFKARDFINDGSAEAFANELVVTTGASGANEIETGYHTLDSLETSLNAWLASEKAAARIRGVWTISTQSDNDRCVIRVELAAAGAGTVRSFTLGLPARVAYFLGFNSDLGDYLVETTEVSQIGFSTTISFVGPDAPFRVLIGQRTEIGGGGIDQGYGLDVEQVTGEWAEQSAWLPASLKGGYVGVGETWGIVKIGSSILAMVEYASATSFSNVVFPYFLARFGSSIGAGEGPPNIGLRVGEPGHISIQQVILLEGSPADILLRLFASTGTAGYNHATYDEFPSSLGAGIPWEILGDDFVNSVLALDDISVAQALLLFVDKPTKLEEMILGDLLLRRAHLVWKDQSLRFTSWSTPATGVAVHTFTEANKATPTGVKDSQRTATETTDEFLFNVVKIEYNRSLDGSYQDTIEIIDQAAIDKLGTSRPITIRARNTYAGFAAGGDVAESLAASVGAWLPYFSMPITRLRRTVDFSLWQDVAPGDLGTIADNFARDPATGARRLSGKPCLVIGTYFDPGGYNPDGTKRDISGRVDLVIFDTDRFAAYAPCAQVDDTAGGAGYNAGTKTLTFYAHQHSETSESVDVASFVATDAVTVVEIDPSNPAAPLSWNDVIVSVNAGTNTCVLTTGLAGFDTAKKYRMISRYYTSATATQKAKCYQADDADSLIQDVAQPFDYGSLQVGAYTASAGTELFERHADLATGDGAPLDIGYERSVCRNLNILTNYKTACIAPSMPNAAALAGGGAGWHLLQVRPIYLGPQELLGLNRYLGLQPVFRSSSGASITLRATLSRHPPTGDSQTDVTISSPKTSATWTTSSSTLQTGAKTDLDISPIRADGYGFLIWEGTQDAELYGPGGCQLGAGIPT